MTSKTFTIVTVTYNAEDLLEQTIKSVIKQDFKDIEYIIIDGKSTDKTLDIIKKYEKYISYWISEKDEGIYDAMNKAIEKATGSYINFLNAGDIFSSSDVLSLVAKEFNDNIDFVYGGVNLIQNGNIVESIDALDLSYIWKEMPLCSQSLFVKTSLAKLYKFEQMHRVNGDLDFILKLYTNSHAYKIIPKPLSDFLLGGFHAQDVPRRYLDEMYVTSKYMKTCKDIYKHQSCTRFVSDYLLQEQNHGIYYQYFNVLLEQILHINAKYKHILLYGNSSVCKVIEKFLTIKYKIIDISVKNDDKRYINPKNITNYDYDAIFITLLGREEQISFDLEKFGVPKEKIKRL